MTSSPIISYTLGMSKPSTHLFEVEMLFNGLDAKETSLELSLPVWRTGRYVVLELAGGIVEFNAFDETNRTLRWSKINKSVWKIEPNGSKQVRVHYKVFANEFNLRTRG